MALASYLDPSWTPNPDVNPNSLQGLAAPAPSVAETPPPAAVPPGPMSSQAPGGVDYAAPGGAPGAGTAPVGPPPTLRGISADDAIKLARQGMGKPQAAHFQPTTQSVSLEGRTASPELEQATKDKLEADANAGVAQFKFDRANAAAQNQAGQRLSAFDEAQANQRALRVAEQQQLLAGDRDHITNLMAQASAPQQDASKEYWGSKSTLDKIGIGLSMFLKGFVFSGYGRGESPDRWLNDQIQQVVQAQQARAARNREAVGNAKDLYAMNKEALGDVERTKLATEMALRQQIVSRLDRRVAEATAGPAGDLQLANLRKTLSDQNAATLEQFWDKTADKHTQSTTEKYVPSTLGGPDWLTVLRRAKEGKQLTAELANDIPEQTTALDLQKKALENQKTGAEAQKAAAAAAQPGGGKGAGRALLRGMAANLANINALEELGRLSRGLFKGPEDKARANVLLKTLADNGVKGLPEEITNEGWQSGSAFSRLTGSMPAAVEQARKEQVDKFNRAQELIRSVRADADLDQPIEGAEKGVAPE